METQRDDRTLEEKIIEALQTVYDPEIPVNIYELGLIYGIDADPSGAVLVRMTLTSPNCPVAESLPREVERKVGSIEGVSAVMIDIVWDPPWGPEMMSDAARIELNLL